MVASCSSSLDPKSTYTLLLGIPVASASRPIDNPSSPSTVASRAACRGSAAVGPFVPAPPPSLTWSTALPCSAPALDSLVETNRINDNHCLHGSFVQACGGS
jgi:hypothetical protein